MKLLHFAALRDLAGRAEEAAELPASVKTVGDLLEFLEATRPALRGRLGSVRFAVNETFVGPDHALSTGDVIALIPPVSGG